MSSITRDEWVQLIADLRYTTKHGALCQGTGIRHDDPARHKVYEAVKQSVAKELEHMEVQA